MVQGEILATIEEGSEKENKPTNILGKHLSKKHLLKDALLTELDSAKIRARKTIEKEDKVFNILGLSIPQLYVLNSLNITKSSSSTSSLNKEFIHEPLQLFSLGSLNITRSSSVSSLNKELIHEPLQLFSLNSLNITKSSSVSSLNKKLNGEPLQLFSLDSLNITKSSSASSLNNEFIREPTQLLSLGHLSALDNLIEVEAKAAREREARERAERERAEQEARERAEREAREREARERAEQEAQADAAQAQADAAQAQADAAKAAAKAAAGAALLELKNALTDYGKRNEVTSTSVDLSEGIEKITSAYVKVREHRTALATSSRAAPLAPREKRFLVEAAPYLTDARTALKKLEAAKAIRANSETLKENQRMLGRFSSNPDTFKTQVSKIFNENFKGMVTSERTGVVSVKLDKNKFIAQLKDILLGNKAYMNKHNGQSATFTATPLPPPRDPRSDRSRSRQPVLLAGAVEAAERIATNIANSIDIPEPNSCRGSGQISEIEIYNFMKGYWRYDGDNISVLAESIEDPYIPQSYKKPLISSGDEIISKNVCLPADARTTLERTILEYRANAAMRSPQALTLMPSPVLEERFRLGRRRETNNLNRV